MAKMPNLEITVRFDDEQLEVLAARIVELMGDQRPTKVSDVVTEHLDKPEVDVSDIKAEPKDDLGAWDIDTEGLAEDIKNGYDDNYEEITLHDLTNAELEQVINENPHISHLLRSKMVKDELVQLASVGFAIDAGTFDHLLKDDLLLAAEALHVRDQITTKTRKDDVLALVIKTALGNRA